MEKWGPRCGLSQLLRRLLPSAAAPWNRLEESDLRLVSLRISVAREWIFESARRPELLQALGEETQGLPVPHSPRRFCSTESSRGIGGKSGLQPCSPIFFSLGGAGILDHFKTDPWSSPVTDRVARRRPQTNDGSRLRILGSIKYHTFGLRGIPTFSQTPPYEEYERQFSPRRNC